MYDDFNSRRAVNSADGEFISPNDTGISADNKYASANDEYINDFLLETKEHLENIEMNIMSLKSRKHNAELIDGIFRDFHSIKGLAGFVSQDLIRTIAHQTESILDKCRKGELEVTDALIRLILESSDFINSICVSLSLNHDSDFIAAVNAHLDSLSALPGTVRSDPRPNPADDTVARERALNETIDKILFGKKDMYVADEEEQPAIKPTCPEVKPYEQPIVDVPPPSINHLSAPEESAFVRIPIERINALSDMAGELIIAQTQLEQRINSEFARSDEIERSLYGINSLAREIHNLAMLLRMVSLKPLFNRIKRIGNDTVSALEKRVELVLYGEDTEVDRNIVEKLLDPLVHLIKNAIYHGIESPSERAALGKPETGRIELRAYGKRENVYIEVSDDGMGIDINAVLKHAIEKSFVDPHLDYSDTDILSFLFLPGFTTLRTVDEVSGRGVGLDVVKTRITKLGGMVTIKSSPGEGTTFIMKLPANISIVNGIVVEVCGEFYILPSLSVKSVGGGKPDGMAFDLEKNAIPTIDIVDLLELESFDMTDALRIILESRGKRMAFPVNKVLDKRDFVVKPLGLESDSVDYALGASVLGNGKIAIILDVENIFKRQGD